MSAASPKNSCPSPGRWNRVRSENRPAGAPDRRHRLLHPGRTFALVSTMVMTVVPAKIAGVRHIQVACPRPELRTSRRRRRSRRHARSPNGRRTSRRGSCLRHEARARVRENLWARAIVFVTAAKQLVSSDCAIDLPAGQPKRSFWPQQATRAGSPRTCSRRPNTAPDAGSYLVTTSTASRGKLQNRKWRANYNNLPPTNPAHISIKTHRRNSGRAVPSCRLRIRKSIRAGHLSLPGNGRRS